MTEKAFRLDFFIAIAALLASSISAIALLIQTRVIADQYAATIWPYVSSDETAGPRGLALQISNDGLGPALIGSAQLVVDGKDVAGWSQYFHALLEDAPTHAYFTSVRHTLVAGKPFAGSISSSALGPGRTLRPGDTVTLMRIDLPPDAPVSVMNRHTLALRLCYCSLNKSCWTLDTGDGKHSAEHTASVASCTNAASIEPAAFTSSAVKPKT